MSFIYGFFRLMMRWALDLYFRKIRIEGLEKVPRGVPLLVVPNHQNALIDPLLVGAFIPIPLHFLTRADVFKGWLKSFFTHLNMMPIYRIRDGYHTLGLNEQVFSRCFEVFKRNQSVLIFPEGNHGKEYYLRPLTKGAARLALQAQQKLDQELMILPVGLNYFDHHKPQSTVLVRFGELISVRQYLKLYQENEARGLIAMRDAIASAMRDTLIIPQETADYIMRKELVFQPKHENLSFDELKRLEVSTLEQKENKGKPHVWAKVLNPIPFLLIHYILCKVDDVVFLSTFKFGIGLLAFPLWWVMVFVIFSVTVGMKIASLAVVVMILGLFFSYQR